MQYWLVGHGARGREVYKFDNNRVVCCDSLRGNQDPYIWGGEFITTFCKTNDLKDVSEGDILVWCIPYKGEIYCDLVFQVGRIYSWKQANRITIKGLSDSQSRNLVLNHIEKSNIIVHDNEFAFNDHFLKGIQEHYRLTDQDRRTLKSTDNPEFNYQPLDNNKLINISNLLTDDIIKNLRKKNKYFNAVCLPKDIGGYIVKQFPDTGKTGLKYLKNMRTNNDIWEKKYKIKFEEII